MNYTELAKEIYNHVEETYQTIKKVRREKYATDSAYATDFAYGINCDYTEYRSESISFRISMNELCEVALIASDNKEIQCDWDYLYLENIGNPKSLSKLYDMINYIVETGKIPKVNKKVIER